MATDHYPHSLSTQSFEIDIPDNFEVRSISMNDREEIRRRLAMESDWDETVVTKKNSRTSKNEKKCYLNKVMNKTSDLRLCFLNDSPIDLTETRDLQKLRQDAFNRISNDFSTSSSSNNSNLTSVNCSNVTQLSNSLDSLCLTDDQRPRDLMLNLRRNKMERFKYILNSVRPNDMSTFHRYHSLIIAEARFALNQAKEMARVQMETEKLKVKPSSIANLIQIPLNDRFTEKLLLDMSIAKLQILVNDLHSRIEALNEELVGLLQERDDLHMEQDSILVDIEDATIFLLRRMKFKNPRNHERKSSH